MAGKLANTPTCVTYYHGPVTRSESSWPRTTWLAMQFADRVLTDSEISAREFRLTLKRSREHVVAVPNGIPRPRSKYSAGESRRLLGLPDDPYIHVIGQIGRLVQSKGQAVLLRPAAKAIRDNYKIAVLIVGYADDPQYRCRLSELANELGIKEHVHILSYPGPVGDIWTAIDIHVHASLFDSQPIAVIEGMSLGKPAIVTSVGGITEIVEDGVTGLIVPPDDSDRLAECITKLISNDELAGDLGAAARIRYELYHRPELMVESLGAVFRAMARAWHSTRQGISTAQPSGLRSSLEVTARCSS
jgi:glycosyltransferase involved in cell wall biosynthesis